MISKETFVNTIEYLMELDEKMNTVDEALKSLNGDFCGFYMTEPFDIIVGLLEEMFDDTETNWLSYFIWERDWLRNFSLGNIKIDNKAIKIENWSDVYDFLISNKG